MAKAERAPILFIFFREGGVFMKQTRRLGFLPALLIAALLLAACILLAGLSAGRQAPGSRPVWSTL